MSEPVAQGLEASIQGSEPPWTALGWFNVYRMLLAGLLLLLVLGGRPPRPLGLLDLSLFQATAGLYLGFSFLAALCGHLRRPVLEAQVGTAVFVDIVALTVLTHASGGLSSGLGMLLLVAIAGGSILIEGRLALLFAALGSLAVLSEQVLLGVRGGWPLPNYPHAGLLGVAMFATAWLAWLSSRRIRVSEALAARRGVDLANLAQLNEHVIGRMQSGILAVDGEGRIRLANRSAEQLLALPGAWGETPLSELRPRLAGLMDRWRREGGPASHLYQRPDGHIKLVVSFAPIGADGADGMLVFVEDAAVMHQRAQQLKLASLGRLSASIAHEIRNPLGAVGHASQLLAESSHLDTADRRLLDIIRGNVSRMDAIVESVMQLGRQQPAEPARLELRAWLEELRGEFLALGRIDPEVLAITVDPPDLAVRVDPGQLHQVVWNLCENALRHAGNPPRIELRAGIAADTARPWLEVADNGPGVPEEAAEDIFEPFFTTRREGTGLGLYVSRELCEGNQATLNLVPEGGGSVSGACFRVTFNDPRRQGVQAA
jgi:two-component system, NtrC family, sensor histidine kinase PilS